MALSKHTKLLPKHHECINLILAGYDNQQIAKVLKVDRSTIWRWKHTSFFEKELEKRQSQVRDELVKTILKFGHAAFQTLFDIMVHPKTCTADKIKAAKEIRAGVMQVIGSSVKVTNVDPTDVPFDQLLKLVEASKGQDVN